MHGLEDIEKMTMREIQLAIVENHEQLKGLDENNNLSENERSYYTDILDNRLHLLLIRRKFLRDKMRATYNF